MKHDCYTCSACEHLGCNNGEHKQYCRVFQKFIINSDIPCEYWHNGDYVMSDFTSTERECGQLQESPCTKNDPQCSKKWSINDCYSCVHCLIEYYDIKTGECHFWCEEFDVSPSWLQGIQHTPCLFHKSEQEAEEERKLLLKTVINRDFLEEFKKIRTRAKSDDNEANKAKPVS